MEDFLLYCFIKNSLYRPLSKRAFFALLLYKKRPLLVFFGLYWSLSITALIKDFSLSQEWPLSRIFCFIALSKMVFIGIYPPLLKTAFSALLLCPLLKTAFIGLYHKRPFSLYRFI